jgi:Mn-containing catalase
MIVPKQTLNTESRKTLMDIGTEELTHLVLIGTLARAHLKPCGTSRAAAEADPLITICGGGGVNLFTGIQRAAQQDRIDVTADRAPA